MEEEPQTPGNSGTSKEVLRCPQCDSVVAEGTERCLMCGTELASPGTSDSLTPAQESPPKRQEKRSTILPLQKKFARQRRNMGSKSAVLWVLIILTFLFTLGAGIFILRGQGSQVILALQPTFTPLPLRPTLTPTWTPEATETPPATPTPVPSATPVPTDTPRPPRFHTVESGETLFGLSLLYRISPDSIAQSNDLALDSQIQVGQQLDIPWPTPTPPLESMVLEIGGEQVVADVTDCEIITIQEGDSAYGLSAQRGVPAPAIVAVNRLTDESIQLLHPGDTLCIPRIIPGDTLPPTPGPQPTATGTAFPAGPTLLFPVNNGEVSPPDGLLRLQWVSVKDLADEEWYMVEVSDLDMPDSLPYRAFTRDSSLKAPGEWRPAVPETHEMRWRVSIVRVTGRRSDGEMIYEYGGRSSEDSYFSWLGALPTPTPTITPTPTTDSSE